MDDGIIESSTQEVGVNERAENHIERAKRIVM
jgi:hypothetical protein